MYSRRSAGLRWKKSSHSGSQTVNCVEVAHTPELIAVRDSTDPDGPILAFAPATFAAFLARTKLRAG